MKKGNSVYIEGKIITRKWEDKDGNVRYSTDIVADKMTMLGSKQESSSIAQPKNNEETNSSNSSEQLNNDDLPF